VWDIIFKAITAVTALFGLRALIPIARATLKIDLEILNLLKTAMKDESGLDDRLVKAHVKKAIDKIYGDKTRQKFFRDPDLLGFPAFLLFFGIFLYLLRKDGLTLWSVLSLFVALTGLGRGILAVDRRIAARKSRSRKEQAKLPEPAQCHGGADDERRERGVK